MKKVGKGILAAACLGYIIFPDIFDPLNAVLPGLGFVDDATAGVFLVGLLRSIVKKDKKEEETEIVED